MKSRYRETERTSNWGAWRDLILGLRMSEDHSEIIECAVGQVENARSGLYKASRVQGVTLIILRLSKRLLRVTVVRDPDPPKKPEPKKPRAHKDKLARKVYRFARRKGLPCTITPEEIRRYR